ncbi:MAG: protein kinase [Myxococcota bacterium]
MQSANVAEVLGEPERVGSELRWSVRLVDGRRGCFAQLLAELARDEAVRQRYVGDLRRLRGVQGPGLAALLDASSEDASQPWRLREEPEGESLEAWIDRRAPAPIAEVSGWGAQLCDTLNRLHREGVVVRDLHPRVVVLTAAGPVLTDVGLARVDLLSTRTAASLVLEGSPFASPEQLRKTVLDQRSDLYGLGVLLWFALTQTKPYGDDIALLADPDRKPVLRGLRAEIPPALAACVERCVEHDPERRPESAAAVAAVLRGEAASFGGVARVACQSCGASLLQGQRLCLSCGKEAVAFESRVPEGGSGYRVMLRKVEESVETHARLRSKLELFSAGKVRPLNFISGDMRMYSKAEKERSIRLPKAIFAGLDEDTAKRLATELAVPGVKTVVRRERAAWVPIAITAGVLVFGLSLVMIAAGGTAALLPMICMVAMAFGIGFAIHKRRKSSSDPQKAPMLELRKGPAALPASDPLVARLASLHANAAADVRERLGHIALTLQQLIDHRARLPEVERNEVDLVTEPIAALVDLLEAEAGRIAEIDATLPTLDEGVLVRALASARARGAMPTEIDGLLEGLARLRDLEESRAAALHRLLEATTLLRRAVELGLSVRDEQAAADAQVKVALAALGG